MKSNVLPILLLVVVSFIVYGQTVGFEFVQYDDPAYVSENGIVTQGVTAKGVYWAFTMQGETHLLMHEGVANLWHPLTWISHMLDCSLFGHESAMGHHLVNLLLHTFSGILVLMLARVLGMGSWASFAGALLFLIHPMKAESVAWVSERKDTLSGFFFVLSVYLTFVREGKYRWIGLLAFALALLSKPSVVILPPLLVLLTLWRNGDNLFSLSVWVRESLRWLPWFALSVIVAVVTVLMQAGGSHQAFMGSFPLAYRVITMASGLLYYVYHLVIPHHLNFHYAPPTVPGYIHYLSWIVVILFLGVVYRWRARFPILSVCVLWFLICWLPSSGIFYVGTSFTCDRYVYLASILPSLYLAQWAFERRESHSVNRRPVRIVAWGLILLVMSVLCFRQVSVWKSSRTLFEHAVKAQPKDPLGWTNLGALNSLEERKDEAITCYERAIEINPNEYFALHNLGDLYRKQGRLEEALEQFIKTNKCAPSYMPSWRARGMILREQKKYAESIEVFQEAFKASNNQSATELWLMIETMLVAERIAEAERGVKVLRTLRLTPYLEEQLTRAEAFLKKVKQASQ